MPETEVPSAGRAVVSRLLLSTLATLAIAPLGPAPGHAAQGARSDAVTPAALADTGRVRRWREDLRFITDAVRRDHPRPFAFSSPSSFDSAAQAIERSIPSAGDARLAAECMRLVAALGDGHTMVIGTFPQLGFTAVLPIYLKPFEDGLYIAAADSAYATKVGAKVVRIGDLAADEAVARVAAVTSGDNRLARLDRLPLFLMMPRLLHELGISPEADRVTLEIERASGQRERVAIPGGAPPAGFPGLFLETEPLFPDAWTRARHADDAHLPRCDRRPEEPWWFEFLSESKTLYLRLRRIDPLSGDLAYFEMYRRLFAEADRLKPRALIIDLRHDHGGNNSILDPLIRGIVQRPWLDREGSLFALIDRGTFSAAMNAAVFLEDQTRVMFVGEPTGGRVNHYGDASEARTPNYGMMVQVSTLPWFSRDPSDDRVWIAPDLATPSTFADWRDGRDTALEAALSAVRDGTPARLVLEAARGGGGGAGKAANQAWTRAHPNPWDGRTAGRSITLVSDLMDRGEWGDAAAIGESLVQIDPSSTLAWRVLGEAHAALGHRPRAIECLRRALELNPRAQVARLMLRRLGEAP